MKEKDKTMSSTKFIPPSPFVKASAQEFAEVMALLRTPPEQRADLFARADSVRKEMMGDEVYLRGIIEFSNICANACLYCGIRAENTKVNRYTISDEEILDVAHKMSDWQQGTLVLQSGEADSPANNKRIGELITKIKEQTSLALTLSAGNRARDVYAYWADCGVDRYLLRFETCDPDLFEKIHPDCTLAERLDCLTYLRELGVQVGSGFMIGVPEESLEILAGNILLCREYALDMIGVGPFIPHPDTPMGTLKNQYAQDQDMFFVAIAALRLMNKDAHIPATTAFDAVFPDHDGRNKVLMCGGNVFMPNTTPLRYRGDYLLYPDKPCVDEDSSLCALCIPGRISMLGRTLGQGRGDSPRWKKRSGGDGGGTPRCG